MNPDDLVDDFDQLIDHRLASPHSPADAAESAAAIYHRAAEAASSSAESSTVVPFERRQASGVRRRTTRRGVAVAAALLLVVGVVVVARSTSNGERVEVAERSGTGRVLGLAEPPPGFVERVSFVDYDYEWSSGPGERTLLMWQQLNDDATSVETAVIVEIGDANQRSALAGNVVASACGRSTLGSQYMGIDVGETRHYITVCDFDTSTDVDRPRPRISASGTSAGGLEWTVITSGVSQGEFGGFLARIDADAGELAVANDDPLTASLDRIESPSPWLFHRPIESTTHQDYVDDRGLHLTVFSSFGPAPTAAEALIVYPGARIVGSDPAVLLFDGDTQVYAVTDDGWALAELRDPLSIGAPDSEARFSDELALALANLVEYDDPKDLTRIPPDDSTDFGSPTDVADPILRLSALPDGSAIRAGSHADSDTPLRPAAGVEVLQELSTDRARATRWVASAAQSRGANPAIGPRRLGIMTDSPCVGQPRVDLPETGSSWVVVDGQDADGTPLRSACRRDALLGPEGLQTFIWSAGLSEAEFAWILDSYRGQDGLRALVGQHPTVDDMAWLVVSGDDVAAMSTDLWGPTLRITTDDGADVEIFIAENPVVGARDTLWFTGHSMRTDVAATSSRSYRSEGTAVTEMLVAQFNGLAAIRASHPDAAVAEETALTFRSLISWVERSDWERIAAEHSPG